MGIAMDDFSFPQVADDQIVNLTITPSLWRISSLVFSEYNHYKEDDTSSLHNLRIKSSGSGSGSEEEDDTYSMHNLRIKSSEEDVDTHSMHNFWIKSSGSEEDYDTNSMHNLRIKSSEEDYDTNSMHNLQIRSSGSGAEEKMDTLWEHMNDYDFHSKRLVINEAVVQSSRTNHQESWKKSKINTVVIKVTRKLFSLRIMAGAKRF